MIAISHIDVPIKKVFHPLVRACVNAVLKHRKKEISIVACSDEYILQMNKQSLNHDYYTDIITYHYENTPNNLEAELLISVERIAENAITNKIPFEHELARIIIHGCLHLNGYDDKTPKLKKEMTNQEDKYLTEVSNLLNK